MQNYNQLNQMFYVSNSKNNLNNNLKNRRNNIVKNH